MTRLDRLSRQFIEQCAVRCEEYRRLADAEGERHSFANADWYMQLAQGVAEAAMASARAARQVQA